jgi:hypothetical protein
MPQRAPLGYGSFENHSAECSPVREPDPSTGAVGRLPTGSRPARSCSIGWCRGQAASIQVQCADVPGCMRVGSGPGGAEVLPGWLVTDDATG